jgi:hypothetical protein
VSGAAQALVFAIAGASLVFVIWLVRRGSLKDRFAVLWLGIAAGLILLALARPVLDGLSDELGIEGTTTLFLAALVFQAGLLLHLSVIVSRLEAQVRDITTAHALMESELASRPPGDGA